LPFLHALLLLYVALLAYANSFSGMFLFDDEYAIQDNPLIRHPIQFWREILAAPRPVVTWTLAANFAYAAASTQEELSTAVGTSGHPVEHPAVIMIPGNPFDVWGYHAFNLATHVLAGWTLYGLVRRTLMLPALRSRFGAAAPWLALATALLWLLHPLQTESVTYIIQRSEALMGLFYLLTLYCVLRGATTIGRAIPWFVAAVISCALGMGSKEVMVSAPLAALLYDRIFLAASWREVVHRRWGLYAALAATWGLLAVPLKAALGGKVTIGPLETIGQAGFGFQQITPLEYARSQPGVLLHYLRLSFWPHPLCLDYAWPVAQEWQAILIPGLVVAGLLLLTLWALWRRPMLGFLGTVFFLILLPTSSIMPIRDLAVEHRMYLSLAAEVVLATLGGFMLVRLLAERGWLSQTVGLGLAAMVGVAAVAMFGRLTFARNLDYQSGVRMWSDVVAQRPGNARAFNNLGTALQKQGNLSQAIPRFERAVELDPTFLDALNNLGVAYVEQGKSEQGLACFRRIIAINPGWVLAYYHLGNTLRDLGKLDDAARQYEEAIRINPGFALARCNLGNVLVNQGKLAEAVPHFEAALEINPDYGLARYNLGLVRLWQGAFDEAAELEARALPHLPDPAQGLDTRGIALSLLGRAKEAEACFVRAVRLKPSVGKYYYDLGFAYHEAGRQADAQACYEQAVRLEPRWPVTANVQAWRLATSPDSSLRNAGLALHVARQICDLTGNQVADFLDTLAAAYASTGDFARAQESARKALALPTAMNEPEHRRAMEERLRLYEKGRPYQDSPGKRGKWE
jgi:tetratricopeptide (TPR) repeat protein